MFELPILWVREKLGSVAWGLLSACMKGVVQVCKITPSKHHYLMKCIPIKWRIQDFPEGT